MKLLLLSAFCGLILNAAAQESGTFGTENQQSGYVEVRPGAQIFWWLYHTTASKNITEKPLLIVIPGGPGIASSYFYNFQEIGPLDGNLKPRNTSWVHSANVLFVDSPVGTGFSSVKSDDLYATTDEQVAEDFVNFLRGFYKAAPNFENVPAYIVSSGYGGKAAVNVALKIHQAVKNNTLAINVKGVGLGSPWISPLSNILLMPAYLYQLGYLDIQEFTELSQDTENVQNGTDVHSWNGTLAPFLELVAKIEKIRGGVNIYNIQETKQYDFNTTSKQQNLMDKIKSGLKLNTTFNGVYNAKVFNALGADFNKPAIDILERLLNETDISVAVYNGQLDVSTNIMGTTIWLTDELAFNGSKTYWSSYKKKAIIVDGIVEGFKTGSEKLSFYTVLRAGHFIAKDNPKAAQYILEKITDNFKV